jgi:choline kinase
MKALLLAAGVGRRLGDASSDLPKALLRFGGKSLLQRHIEILRGFGITDVTVTVGHRADAVQTEIERIGAAGSVRTVENARYREGSVVSLWSARSVLQSGAPVLLMDADVLYDARLMGRLLTAGHENCFLLDRDIEPGEEPVKLCIRGGGIVDFHKRPQHAHDWHGESIGFFRFSPVVAADLAKRTDDYVTSGRTTFEYEEPMRDMVLASPVERFGFAEVTGLPWVEIDFAADVERARDEILPKLVDAPATMMLGTAR